MSIIFELAGFVEQESGRIPFALILHEAERAVESEDYFCRIELRGIFTQDKFIYGIDSGQANKLAIKFIINFMENKRVLDIHGSEIIMSELISR